MRPLRWWPAILLAAAASAALAGESVVAARPLLRVADEPHLPDAPGVLSSRRPPRRPRPPTTPNEA